MISEIVRQKLKKARLESGLKWPFFAAKIGVSQDVLKKIQSNTYCHVVSESTKQKFEAIGITKDDWK